MQETNLFLQMIEKCMQKLSKEAEGEKKNGYRVTGNILSGIKYLLLRAHLQ